MSVLLLTIALDANSKPLDSERVLSLLEEPMELSKIKSNKRSPNPLEVGFVTFGSSSDHNNHIPQNVPAHISHEHLVHSLSPVSIHVPDPVSTASLKTETIVHGPFVDHSSVVNLVEHEIHQTHNPSKNDKHQEHLVVVHPPIILHNINSIQGLNYEHPKPSKTAVSTKVSHIITEDSKVHLSSHTVNHVRDSVDPLEEALVPVVSVSNHVVVPSHVKVIATPNIKSHNEVEHVKVEEHPIALPQRSDYGRSHYRERIGGYGAGLDYGGQGAGHGYYAGR